MLTPAREHDLPIALDTGTLAEQALPDVVQAGINIIQFTGSDVNTLERLTHSWYGRCAFIAGLPVSMLDHTPRAELDNQIGAMCKRFSQRTGLVFSLDARAFGSDDYPPQNFVAILRAIQRHG